MFNPTQLPKMLFIWLIGNYAYPGDLLPVLLGLLNVAFFSLQASMDGSASNVPDRTGRSFPSPYSVQSGADSLGFHHTGE